MRKIPEIKKMKMKKRFTIEELLYRLSKIIKDGNFLEIETKGEVFGYTLKDGRILGIRAMIGTNEELEEKL